MKFFQYQDVPLCLGVRGKSPEYVFAENASISVTQPLQVVRNLDDNILKICDFGFARDIKKTICISY